MSPRDPIVGKVAGVEDEFTILINKGSSDGVKLGTVFVVEPSAKGRPVKDPDTGKILGYRPAETLDVRVREVNENYSVAETFRVYSLLDAASGPRGFTGFNSLSMRERDKITGAPSRTHQLPKQRATEVVVNIGDVVREVLDAK